MSVLIKNATKQQVMKVLMNSTEWLPDDIEIIEIQTPHGRLIDGDDLITAFPANENGTDVKIASVRGTMLHAPTVIEAEGQK